MPKWFVLTVARFKVLLHLQTRPVKLGGSEQLNKDFPQKFEAIGKQLRDPTTRPASGNAITKLGLDCMRPVTERLILRPAASA